MQQADYLASKRDGGKTGATRNAVAPCPCSASDSPSVCVIGGFTLIEVLIAVVVLSVGIVLVLQAMHGALSAWDGGVERMRSAMLVQEQLEQWRLAARTAGEVPPDARGRFEPPFAEYLWQVESETIRLPETTEESGALHELLCTVQREGRARPFSAATRIYLPPVNSGTPGEQE